MAHMRLVSHVRHMRWAFFGRIAGRFSAFYPTLRASQPRLSIHGMPQRCAALVLMDEAEKHTDDGDLLYPQV